MDGCAEGEEGGVHQTRKTLGAYFPTAQVVKVARMLVEPNLCTILLFYQYAKPLWSKERRDALVESVIKSGTRRNMGGRIRVACEGVNATVSGTSEAIRGFTQDLRSFDNLVFANTDFKFIDSLPADRAFKDLKVYPCTELVFYGIGQETSNTEGGVHLEPTHFHEKLRSKDAVVIDVRNHYEADIGRFNGQNKDGGAKYIDPMMRKSTDFLNWLTSAQTKSELQGKEVLMYCTGGVRCERASALVKQHYGKVVSGIYQLQGGIEKYLQEFPSGGYWKGKNFVFDKREAFGVDNPAGIGGVVVKPKKGTGKVEILSHCCCCGIAWERYIGKKKCYTCGVPVLMCDKCMTARPDKPG